MSGAWMVPVIALMAWYTFLILERLDKIIKLLEARHSGRGKDAE